MSRTRPLKSSSLSGFELIPSAEPECVNSGACWAGTVALAPARRAMAKTAPDARTAVRRNEAKRDVFMPDQTRRAHTLFHRPAAVGDLEDNERACSTGQLDGDLIIHGLLHQRAGER